jgi:hypothetical protein
MEQAMKKLLLTSIAVLSLAAPPPAGAQGNTTAQPSSGSSSAQPTSKGAMSNVSRDQIMRAQQALDRKGFDAG